ncbi:MAG TPA: c-type cytochrome, partial [Anaeromyxobacteraceae bacterium]|nr:c-type cytochrome [Anaeromyxobacteraceae bacterium]
MRKQTALLAVLLAAACSGPQLPRSSRGAPVLEVRGAVKHGPFRLGRADLEALPRRTVRGRDPSTGRLAAWEGPELAALVVDRVELTRGADVVLVRTADRQAVPVPLALIRQLKPVLAERADGAPLPEPVVAWPTEEQRGLETDPRARAWWAHGVVALELVNGYATLGRAVAVPPGAPDGARLGADLFAARCIACHRLRSAGGEAGPDLTRVAERMTEQ